MGVKMVKFHEEDKLKYGITMTMLVSFGDDNKVSTIEMLAYNDIQIEYYDTPPLDTKRWE